MLIQELLQQLTEAESEKIEAYGVKGMKSTQWRKTFKNQAEFEKWLDKQDGNVEVQGTRKLEEGVKKDVGPAWWVIDADGGDAGPFTTAKQVDKAKKEMVKGDKLVYGILQGATGEIKKMRPPVAEAEVIDEQEQLDEKVFDEDKYTWYVWTQGKPSQSFERRGGTKQLTKGMQFGLRPATSKAGTWRLIMKQKGPSIIFSIDDATAKSVAKAALELI